ncbi:MAG: S-layer homology domain-containing protein [Eubacteriales bacterium]|nr:S-layer homology domain-containing protein [Eubacteriales bacterium]
MKKRLLSIVLTAVIAAGGFSIPALADSSTTTYDTAYKDLSARTEIYAVTDTKPDSYPFYDAKYEPQCGVYYGRTTDAGTLADGRYGLLNGEGLKNETACSFYYELGGNIPLSNYSYIFADLVSSGERALLINLNFTREADDCDTIINGGIDSRIIETFQYLSQFQGPVFCRVGGEMNVWSKQVSPQNFQKAYRHVVEIGRQYAPNVAFVFSPNYSSGYQIDMDSYYPGDAYVDWIGVSLYYNRYANATGSTDAFSGTNMYGSALLNVQQTVNLGKLHSKPIMITEGGSATSQKGIDTSDFASERIQEAMSFLTMVYPQIKCIIYSDTNFNAAETSTYSITDNKRAAAAYNQAVAANPTLLHSLDSQASYYTKLSDYHATWQKTMTLAAYSYSSTHQTAYWYIDNELKYTTNTYPYTYSLDCNTLTAGSHTIQVVFDDGASKSYSFESAKYYTDTPFLDVPGDRYYTQPVIWAVDNGITYGTTDTTFSPEKGCTRAQIVSFLYRAAGSPTVSGTNAFTDVKATDYYYDAVQWAVSEGITYGTSETAFSPKEDCTRAQVVSLLWRYEHSPDSSSNVAFTDVSADAYYYKAVQWAVESGVTSGTSATTFSPRDTCTRAQIVSFLYRDLNR